MDWEVILIIALAPGLFWLWFFYKQDVYEPEPLSLIAKMVFLGMVATLIAFTLENFIDLFVSGILFAILAAPIVEESVKFLMVREFVYKDKEFDEPMDGIVYAVSVALGFATLENILYLIYQPSFLSFAVTGIIRALFTIPGHALYAVFWGYALGIVKFHAAGKKGKYLLATGLILGIAVHGMFNFLLSMDFLGFAILILIIFPVIFWFAEDEIHKSLITTFQIAHKPFE